MYERFTDRARKVMQLANQEAQRFNHEYIGTEHILLGLVKEGTGTAAQVLKNLDIDLRKIRLEVEKIVLAGPDILTMGKMPHTPRAKKVIDYGIEEARKLGHNYVGTEHIFLGLLREEEGVAFQVLLNLGVKLDRARREILNLLGHFGDVGEVRFTERARRVLELARQEATRFNNGLLAPEHALVGLVKEAELAAGREQNPGLAATVFEHFDVDLSKVRLEGQKLLQRGSNAIRTEKLPHSVELKKVVEYAVEEAHKLNQHHLGTGLLLIGLLREERSIAAQLLRGLGMTLEEVRAFTTSLLLSRDGIPAEPPEPVNPYAELSDLPAEILQEIKQLDAEIARLNEEKEQAVADQDFEKAAHLRDQADKLKKKKEGIIRQHRERE